MILAHKLTHIDIYGPIVKSNHVLRHRWLCNNTKLIDKTHQKKTPKQIVPIIYNLHHPTPTPPKKKKTQALLIKNKKFEKFEGPNKVKRPGRRQAHWTNKMKRKAELKAKRPNIIPDTHCTVSENSKS